MKMIIDCISDLHGVYPKLLGGDLLIVAGDLTASDYPSQYEHFEKEWLRFQKYKKRIVIAGNHDDYISKCNWVSRSSYEYLCDSGTEFEGLKIWGSPWSLWFEGINPHCKAFTGSEDDLKAKYALIPDDVDILITHCPPYMILDSVKDRNCPCGFECSIPTGSKSLLEELDNRIKPKLHVFGHIHEHGGKQLIFKRPGHGMENNTICVNASIIDECYIKRNDPCYVRVEI
jgi:Icc-related predicted phosphoesterase